jgi:hypothetical protein
MKTYCIILDGKVRHDCVKVKAEFNCFKNNIPAKVYIHNGDGYSLLREEIFIVGFEEESNNDITLICKTKKE